MKKVQRYFLDYEFSKNEKIRNIENEKYLRITINDKKNYEINKFFYKQIGKDHFWRDRLVWTNKQWLKYSSNPLLDTWILEDNNNNLIGYYEIEKHDNKEFELINMGILSEYRSKGFGSLLLNHVLVDMKNHLKHHYNKEIETEDYIQYNAFKLTGAPLFSIRLNTMGYEHYKSCIVDTTGLIKF